MTDGEGIEALRKKFPKSNLNIYFQESNQKWFLAIITLEGMTEWGCDGESLAVCLEEALKHEIPN